MERRESPTEEARGERVPQDCVCPTTAPADPWGNDAMVAMIREVF